jgi:hypothetical protein
MMRIYRVKVSCFTCRIPAEEHANNTEKIEDNRIENTVMVIGHPAKLATIKEASTSNKIPEFLR